MPAKARPANPWRYLVPLIWTAVIVCFSSGQFSAAATGSTLHQILQVLGLSLNAEQLDLLHFAIRKGAHLSAYGLLSALWLWAFDQGWSLGLFFKSLLPVALTACWDEWHQASLSSRTGSPHDVALDLLGAVMVQVLWGLSKHQDKENTPKITNNQLQKPRQN